MAESCVCVPSDVQKTCCEYLSRIPRRFMAWRFLAVSCTCSHNESFVSRKACARCDRSSASCKMLSRSPSLIPSTSCERGMRSNRRKLHSSAIILLRITNARGLQARRRHSLSLSLSCGHFAAGSQTCTRCSLAQISTDSLFPNEGSKHGEMSLEARDRVRTRRGKWQINF